MTDRRSATSSTSAAMGSGAMGKAPKERRSKRPKERWLLTRKTWRYMTDAGRRLVPDGAHNRPEDIPKVESYFQEVCRRESRFLLWRKASYPGALAARPSRRRRERRSCRTKASSADEADESTSPVFSPPLLSPTLSPPPVDISSPAGHPDSDASLTVGSGGSIADDEEHLADMLAAYLDFTKGNGTTDSSETPGGVVRASPQFDCRELVDRLERQLSSIGNATRCSSATLAMSSRTSTFSRFATNEPSASGHRALLETLNRYFSKTGSRERIVSSMLTDRKMLESLYFDLRKSKNFGGRITSSSTTTTTMSSKWHTNLLRDEDHFDTDDDYLEAASSEDALERRTNDESKNLTARPPLIHVESAERARRVDWGTQTDPIPEEELVRCERSASAAAVTESEKNVPRGTGRRRSSVENDDVSQSVSDTIKRYLRMARKKSSDTEKADRFKRINYDKNLRNIRAKNVVDMPSEDSFDGLTRASQTDDGWTPAYRNVRPPSSECSSCDELPSPVAAAAPHGLLHSGQAFFAQLLHSSHNRPSRSAGPAAMQKSKSSSNVVQQATKRIFRSRSKSQSRLQAGAGQCEWTPREDQVWGHVNRDSQVLLEDCSLLRLTDAERLTLQQVALTRLQTFNLGVTIRAPPEPSAPVAATAGKSKRRAYLLRRKAKTTGFFDGGRTSADSGSGGGGAGGLVFGIPLWQCIENDRLAKLARPSAELSGDEEPRRHGSRASFGSLADASRNDESGSCESLLAGGGEESTALLTTSGGVPELVESCIRQLEAGGLRTLGLFRVSSSRKRVRQLREEWDAGRPVVVGADGEEQCPHDVATLLKEFLRDLPEPLLCRDLYHPFLLTQRIRNRRHQLEALRYLVQLLPPANRDTLYTLMRLLAAVAERAEDGRDPESGGPLPGNRMDSTNLATVFAPNILHCLKPGATAPSADRPEERSDAINVVRSMIDHQEQLFTVPADMLHDTYLHLMDTHPDLLDRLLSAREAAIKRTADESSGVVSWTTGTSGESSEGQLEQRKTISREEFTHGLAGTGGPDIAMRLRHRDRSSKKRWREESNTHRVEESSVKTHLLQQTYVKTRSSSVDSGGGEGDKTGEDRRQSTPLLLDNGAVITASLRIPVQQQQQPLQVDDSDIPYIEDGCPTDARRRQQPAPPPRRSRYRSASGSDSSQASGSAQAVTASLQFSYDSAVGSSAISSPPFSSVGSTSPPTSPDASTDRLPVTTQRLQFDVGPNAYLRKVSITSTREIQHVTTVSKSASTSSVVQVQRRPAGAPVRATATIFSRPVAVTASTGVLRSKTEDIEKLAEAAAAKDSKKSTSSSEKKKYTKRRYTDSRHDTKHIPDAETLERERAPPATAVAPALYKRRELIASVPKDRRSQLT